MQKRPLGSLFVCLLFFSCGNDRGHCDRFDLKEGNYLQTTEQLSGACGKVDDKILHISNEYFTLDESCQTVEEREKKNGCFYSVKAMCERGKYEIYYEGKYLFAQNNNLTKPIRAISFMAVYENSSFICQSKYLIKYKYQKREL